MCSTGLCAESADLINGGQPREGRCAPAGASPRPEAGARAGPGRAKRTALIIIKGQFGSTLR
jgi:hypothetical protein